MDELWLAVANILSAFTIEKPLDDLGRTVEPSGEYLGARIRYASALLKAVRADDSLLTVCLHLSAPCSSPVLLLS